MHSLRACINVLLVSSVRHYNAILHFALSINFFPPYLLLRVKQEIKLFFFFFVVTTDFFTSRNYFSFVWVYSLRHIMENKFPSERILKRVYGGTARANPFSFKITKEPNKIPLGAWKSEICVTLCVKTKRQILKFILAFVPTNLDGKATRNPLTFENIISSRVFRFV